MTSSPSKSGYKWWESDDKTKRLYTELLAEKIAKSPKKTAKTSTLTRSLSSCSDLRSRIQALEYKGSPPGSPIKRSPSIRSLTSPEDSDTSQTSSAQKYTFETVTMDTLAKYEYIKSPKKKPFGSKDSSSSSSSMSSSPSPPTSGSDEEYEKKKSLSLQKTYDVKERMLRETTAFHEMSGHNKKSWAWSTNDNAPSNQDRWSLSSKDMSRVGGGGKSPAMPTKNSLSPKASPRFSSHDSDAWMRPNPMFMLMTSSQNPELKSFGLSDNTKPPGTSSSKTVSTKERFSKSTSKLEEVPEYKSYSSEETSTDDTRSGGSSSFRARTMGRTFKKDSEERPSNDSQNFNFKRASSSDKKIGSSEDDNKIWTRALNTSYEKDNDKPSEESKKNQDKGTVKVNPVDQIKGDLDVNQITKRFQSLCEEVEQLEFKMYEFSDDIHKLKIGIGIKNKDDNNKTDSVEPGQFKHQYKHAFTLSAGKDLLSERVTARALLMRQYASPSKSPRSIAKLLQGTGIDKEMAEADACKSKALEEELRKINKKDLTEDEIQEVLRSAKSKYIDSPNYLEDVGFSIRNQRKKG
jgi:hypothetical protein